MSFAGASKHVKVLEDAGLIERRKLGPNAHHAGSKPSRSRKPSTGCASGRSSGPSASTVSRRSSNAHKKEKTMAEAMTAAHRFSRSLPTRSGSSELLDAPAEKVWRYLTEAELRQQWFMGGTDATGVGEFELLVDHDKLSDENVPYPESLRMLQRRGLDREGAPLRAAAAARDDLSGRQERHRHLRAVPRRRTGRASSSRTAASPAEPARRTSAAAGTRILRCFRNGSAEGWSRTSGRCIRNRRRRSPRRC